MPAGGVIAPPGRAWLAEDAGGRAAKAWPAPVIRKAPRVR